MVSSMVSGALSDRIGKRKLLVGIGYGLAAITKPVFPLAGTAWEVLAARFVENFKKFESGCPPEIRNAAPRR